MDRASRLVAMLLNPPREIALARLNTILPIALDAFELPEVAYIWLNSPNASLEGFVPIDLILRSDLDAIRVRRVLKEISRDR